MIPHKSASQSTLMQITGFLNSRGRTIFVADPHRNDGKRFVVRADEKLTAFLELESAIRLAIC